MQIIKITLEEYLREDGTNPYKRWFDDLDAQAAAKVTTAKIRLGLGNTSSVKWFDGIGEYIIDWGARLSTSPGMARRSLSCSVVEQSEGSNGI